MFYIRIDPCFNQITVSPVVGEYTAEVTWHERIAADRRGETLDTGIKIYSHFNIME